MTKSASSGRAAPPPFTRPPAAAWLAHRYDPDHDAVHFIAADRATRQRIAFLTDELLGETVQASQVVARAQAVAGIAPAPLHFIFHAAYCCSTLLASVFDHAGIATALKEPVILNDLVGWRHRGGDPARIGAVLNDTLTLLARPFDAREAVIVKPSNVVNALIPAMLQMRPPSRALLLYAPLRVYLTSIARKGMWGRLWVRDLLAKQLADGMVDLGFEPADYLRLTDLQAAAVGWLAQADLFAKVAARFPDRVRSLDSEVLVARPRETLAALASLYALPLDAQQIDALAASDAFGRNAKDGTAFRPDDRTQHRSDGAALHADEIDKVLAWAQAVAGNAGVALDPPLPLLD